MRRLIAGLLTVLATTALAVPTEARDTSPNARVADPVVCPSIDDPRRFASKALLRAWSTKVEGFGIRRPGWPGETEFIDWLEGKLHRLPSVRTESLPMDLMGEQIETGASLTVGRPGSAQTVVKIAGPMPRTSPTPAGGVSAQLVYLPPSVPITPETVDGKILVRDVVYTTLPAAAFYAQGSMYDPEHTIGPLSPFAPNGRYQRAWFPSNAPKDIAAAQKAGARGVLFALPLDREQGRNAWMRPGTGELDVTGTSGGPDLEGSKTFFGITIPALQLGSEEASQLIGMLVGGSLDATLSLTARRDGLRSRSLFSTVPGLSDERVVLTSHTDGLNAIWENGPVAMLALARAYASLPMKCRPLTLELGFVTAHTLTRRGSREYAARLRSRERPPVLTVVLEHLGARGWELEVRTDGRPGQVLRPTGETEAAAVFLPEDPNTLTSAATPSVSKVALDWTYEGLERHKLGRTFVFDRPRLAVGEWGSFQSECGLPALSLIAGPWSMSLPSFTVKQSINIGLMRRQSLFSAEIVRRAMTAPPFPLSPAKPGLC